MIIASEEKGRNSFSSFQFSVQDSVQDLRQVVLDRPESCYRTSFSLQVNGVRLDDFAELHMIDCLKDGVSIKVVEGIKILLEVIFLTTCCKGKLDLKIGCHE